ncbi:MAG: hydroxymethylbilane synthase [Bacteroidetes bacterium 43-16]|nr:MAG: hydroxymethylbilane synthase [Bacteroidetes bacterium 43-16]
MKTIRIGTRDSKLALWQANTVKDLLEGQGYTTELVPVKSEGDLDLVTPLYAMGVEGVFTKTLDAYLLSNKIDIAVHSMKDVPTQLAQGIVQAAVLPRASYKDILVFPKGKTKQEIYSKIGTGSVRRKALLLNRYPECVIENLRGNVQTRLQKLEDSDWDAAVFAEAGLARVALLPEQYETLDWMLPAPAQGAIMIVCRAADNDCLQATHTFNDATTAMAVKVERDFLKTLMGGCSTPVSAFAEIKEEQIYFKGSICSLEGKTLIEHEAVFPVAEAPDAGTIAGNAVLEKGGKAIVAQIRGQI